jgi:Raf kinase inhibitor-like YbhB/YbcL family protein
MQLRAASLLIVAALVPVAAACNDDGRTLRPARDDQVGSVSTLAPVTDPTLPDEIGVVSTTVAPSSPVESLFVTSSFVEGGPIDPRHTCQGENVSPVLNWSPAPDGTVEIAITMVDLDAPSFVHWAIAGLDPLSTSLGEGVVPEFAMQGINGTGQAGYTGPCPPTGETHSYRITVHFLSEQTELGDGAPGADLIASIEAATLASAMTTGTYSQS